MLYNSDNNEIDLLKLDTSNVEDMSSMFDSCNHIQNLSLSEFDAINVKNI